jgi:hypothetical protein
MLNLIQLPEQYLTELCQSIEALSIKAISDGDYEAGQTLLSLVIDLKKPKTTKQVTVEVPGYLPRCGATPVELYDTASKAASENTRARYKELGYDEAVNDMCTGLINLISKGLIDLNDELTSRSTYSVITKHYLTELDEDKLQALQAPMSPSRQDRPRWKEAITQAFNQFIEEGFMEKTGRYIYAWTDKAKNELLASGNQEKSVVIEPLADGSLPQPFAAFSRPRIYQLEAAGSNGTAARKI